MSVIESTKSDRAAKPSDESKCDMLQNKRVIEVVVKIGYLQDRMTNFVQLIPIASCTFLEMCHFFVVYTLSNFFNLMDNVQN